MGKVDLLYTKEDDNKRSRSEYSSVVNREDERAPLRKRIFSYHSTADKPICFSHYKHRHANLDGDDAYIEKELGYYIIYIFIKENISLIINENIFSPACGDIVTLKPGEHYAGVIREVSDIDYYEIDFPLEFFDYVREDSPFKSFLLDREEGKGNMITPDRESISNLFHILTQIDLLLENNAPHSDYMVYSRIIQAASLISNLYENKRAKYEEVKIPATLSSALSYISENYLSISNIEEIAAYCHISVSYLCRVFKKYLGTTPVEYINNKKIARAKYLLKSGYNVTESCYDSGFNSYNYFISAFKKKVGKSPTEFKNNVEDG